MRVDLAHELRVGVPTMDAARYSAPPTPVERLTLLRNGLAVLDFPRMPQVREVHAPGFGGDVVIRIAEPMPRLERSIAPELPARALRPGGFLFLPEGLAADFCAEGGQPRCLHLHVPAAAREAMRDDIGPGLIRPQVNRFDSELDALFAAKAAALREPGPFTRLRLQGLALAALARVLHLSQAEPVRRGSGGALTPARMRRIEAFVEDRLSAEICLEDMAACVGLSPSHFSRAFKAQTGVTPYAWVVGRRVERVKERLLAGRGRLTDIAVDCGFANQSHMTDVFRRATGMAPAQWLRARGAG